MVRSRTVAAFALALAAGACGGGAPEIPTPEVVDDARLSELLRPHGEERLVLANFWATW